MGTLQPFVALTDQAWFDFLAERAGDGRIDEVNFWSPKSDRPLRRMSPGEPVFLRLKAPHHKIAGYGFFAHFERLSLDAAWQLFEWKNGDPDEARFLERIGAYRGLDLPETHGPQPPLGCTVLRDVRLWPPAQWIPWGRSEGWAKNIVRGKSEDDPDRVRFLLDRIVEDARLEAVRHEWAPAFRPLDVDRRQRQATDQVVREGQGTFRARLLTAYGRRCAITGERTEPILDAAHIQPYLGPASNHPQNGLILTKEFHTLFDLGLVGVTPAYRVIVSPQLKGRWQNGRRFYAYQDQALEVVPEAQALRPSADALEWHLAERFQR